MLARWERAPAPPIMSGALYMDAELRPYRSLSASAFKLLLIVFILMNVAVAALFVAQGAFPVAAFLGLDVLALWLAFRFSYRDARRAEYVRIGPEQVHVASVDAEGRAVHWVLNPLFARVVREGPGVVIRARNDQMRVGAFLPPKEWGALAAAIEAALWRAKRG
jgi:uncharacterized membrane protein